LPGKTITPSTTKTETTTTETTTATTSKQFSFSEKVIRELN